MKILDKYILKKYLVSFLFTLFILIPIAIAIDVSEKIDKFLSYPNLTFGTIVSDYYVNFVIYYANTFMPLALFISVVFFTSKIANNTEIVAINSGSISFNRFLRPYLMGATLVFIFALYMNHFVVPKGNATLTKFDHEYISKRASMNTYVSDTSLKLKDGEYIFVENFGFKTNRGTHFSYERYDSIHRLKMKYRLTAEEIRWDKKVKKFRLTDVRKRYLFTERDSIFSMASMDTIFSFKPQDLLQKDYLAKEFTTPALIDFIKVSASRGVKNLNAYQVELYKRTSLPISCYILTLIAVCIAFRKRKNGMGINLALGVSMMFIYIFFMKVGEVIGAGAGHNTFLMTWMPNSVFAMVALGLYVKAIK